MAVIKLSTHIAAPIERVFDLARSIDAHVASASHSGERAIEGRTSGLVEEGETVTWEATHFGVRQRLKVKITEMDRPFAFKDVMISGAFASMSHQHRFKGLNGETKMTDRFEFMAPLGFLGRIAEWAFLERYMKSFMEWRNEELKSMAESDRWRAYLPTKVRKSSTYEKPESDLK